MHVYGNIFIIYYKYIIRYCYDIIITVCHLETRFFSVALAALGLSLEPRLAWNSEAHLLLLPECWA